MRRFLSPVARPVTRFIIGMIAIPALRLVRERVVHSKEWDEEFEKDIEQWFRASTLLFFATKNVEVAIGAWLDPKFSITLDHWYVTAGRLLLAIGVVEAMPDQELFAIVHPGPDKPTWDRSLSIRDNIVPQIRPLIKGILEIHLKRSSPVFAILATIQGGTTGWVCFVIAITQYLIIGLVTSRDKAIDVLSEFDRQVARRRKQLIDDFSITEQEQASSVQKESSSSTDQAGE